MGVKNLSAILTEGTMKSMIGMEDLYDKVIGFDAFNQLFQFMSSIRTGEGESLTDDEGNVTSHLVGILNRGSNLLQQNITPVYVFDGESHEFKAVEQQKRRDARDLAQKAYEEAIAEGDMEKAAIFAARVNRLTPEMVEDAKALLGHMGIPVIQAPGEGEAQAAQLTREGVLFATASQDYDTLVFGSPRLIRNLNIIGKRRMADGSTKTIYPEMYSLQTVLETLELSREQMIDLGIMMGTDFNEGFKGVGPKTAYRYIKKYGSFNAAKKEEKKLQEIEIPYDEIKEIFLNPNVHQNLKIDFSGKYDVDAISRFLERKNFDLGRYRNMLAKTQREIEKRNTQTSLDDWF
ncbi:MAG: flap endonuclease-1 [Candidatus Heimdallarchaeota archaeon]|nr:flap endonuclease-1 [Candidatus Heimdallarchaeota archaeon]